MRYFVTIDGDELTVDVHQRPGGGYRLTVGNGDGEVLASDADLSVRRAGDVTVRVGSRVVDLVMDGTPPELEVTASGRRVHLRLESERMRAAAQVQRSGGGAGDGLVVSPMPGKVVKILVAVGDAVEQGAPVAVIEAMKMENELLAPCSGTIAQVFVAPGDAVEGGARLVTVS